MQILCVLLLTGIGLNSDAGVLRGVEEKIETPKKDVVITLTISEAAPTTIQATQTDQGSTLLVKTPNLTLEAKAFRVVLNGLPFNVIAKDSCLGVSGDGELGSFAATAASATFDKNHSTLTFLGRKENPVRLSLIAFGGRSGSTFTGQRIKYDCKSGLTTVEGPK